MQNLFTKNNKLKQKIVFAYSFVLIATFVFAPLSAFGAQSTFTTSLTTTGLTTLPPSVPTNLIATAVSHNQIDLAWTASVPNYYAIAGYRIFRDSVFVATTTSTSYSDTGLIPETGYSYTVEGFDTLIQLSGQSATSSATTTSAPVATPTPTPTPGGGGNGGGGGSGGTNTLDIFNINIIPGTNQAEVNFNTNVPAQTKLQWGFTTDFEMGSQLNAFYGTEHSQVITGLSQGLTYKLRITANNASGVVTYRDVTFSTILPVTEVGPLPNPSDFVAEPKVDTIELTWVNPNDPRFNDVRIVRTEGFYPIDQYDGIPLYEGDGQAFTDTTAKPGVTYYYAIFSRDREQNYSSGALAQARIALEGEIATTTVVDPFANIKDANNVDPMFKALKLSDFEFIQDGVNLASVGETVAIHGDKNLTIRLKYDKVPQILKTIAFTLKDPTDANKVFPFLLRVNKDKTYYEATIGALGRSGRYGMSVVVLDYENNGLVRLNGTLAALAFTPWIDFANNFDLFGLLILFLIILLIIFAIIMIRKWAHNHPDYIRKDYNGGNNFGRTNSKKVFASVFAFVVFGVALFGINKAQAGINQQINYQGKLTTALNAVVPDGNYNIRFKLYTSSTGGSPIWTETWCNTSDCAGTGVGPDTRIAITNGLFSTMLGSTTAFTGVDFNQPLYLGVEIGGSAGTASWDGEMSPRKIIGTVPAAFVAETANTLTGLNASQFLRSDAQNATSSSSTFLNVMQTGAGKVAEFFGSASQSVLAILSNGNVGIGTTSPGQKLSVAGDILGNNIIGSYFTATSSTASIFPYASTTALTVAGTNGLQLASGLNGPLQAVNGLVTSTSTLSIGYGGTGISTAPSYGQLLVGNSTNGYTLTSTSSLNIQANLANIIGTLAVANGGTGATTFGQGWLYSSGGTGALNSSTSPTVNYLTATSTTATSVFKGGLSVAGTTGLNVLTSGLVGVGKNNPSYELDVNGNVNANNYYVALGGAYRYGGSVIISGTAGDVDPIIFGAQATKVAINTSGAGEIMRFTETGNVGIGTTSPYSKLSVVGEVVARNFTATSTTATSTFPNILATNLRLTGSLYDSANFAGTNGYVLQTTGSGTQWVSTSSLNISSGSSVTGGTAGMLASWINGTTLTATGTPTAASYFASSTTATSTFLGGLSVAGSNGLTVLQNGNVGIGTLSPSLRLSVNGDATVSSKLGIGTDSVPNGQLRIASDVQSLMYISQTDAALNEKNWYFDAEGGDFYWGVNNDLFNGGANYAKISRTGIDIDAFEIMYGYNNQAWFKQDVAGIQPSNVEPTARWHIRAGSSDPSSAPLKIDSGPLLATPEVGAIEFLDDKWYGTITTGDARKEFTLNNNALSSGVIPYVSVNGRLDNSNIYYVGSNLGIGSSSPSSKLSVEGTSSLGNQAIAGYFTATTTTASTFPYASTTALTVAGPNGLTLGSLNGPLQAVNGAVSATSTLSIAYGGTGLSIAPSYGQLLLGNASGGYTLTSTSSLGIQADLTSVTGTLGIANGGTGATTFGQGWLYSNGGTGALNSSTSPTVNYLTATSTTATSTFAGGLNVAGSTGLSVLQSGNVGIGTASPRGALDVSDGNVALFVGADGSANTRTNNTQKIARVIAAQYSNSAAGSTVFIANNSNSSNDLYIGGGSASYNAATGINFYTGANTGTTQGTIRMMINNTGNVGIGTTSPWAQLSVNPNVVTGPAFVIGSSTATNFVVTNGGKVGVGLTNPSSDLSINGGVAIGSYANSTNAGSGNLVMSGVLGVGLTDTLGNKLGVSGTSYFSDKVGIGTSTPYAMLSVAGEIVSNYFTATSTTASSTLPNLLTTNLRLLGRLYDSANSAGTNGYVLQTTGSGTQWVSTTTLNLAGGTGISGGTAGMLAAWTSDSTLTATGTPTAASYLATSTTASIFPYASTTALTVAGTNGLQLASGLNGPLQAVNGLVSSTSTLSIGYGGTGLSTAPSYGQLLLGNASGGYTLTSTSSLGFVTGAAYDWQKETNFGVSTLTPTTTIPVWLKSQLYASSTAIFDGNVGIGSSTPGARLSVQADSAGISSIFSVASSSRNSTLYGYATSTSNEYFKIASGGDAFITGKVLNPTYLGETRGPTPGTSLFGARSIFISGKYAYVANANRDSLAVIDISNPSAPTFIAETLGPIAGTSLNGARSVFVSGKYAYVANANQDSLAVIDISNPYNPTFIAETKGPVPGTSLDGAIGVYVSGKYAYVVNNSRDSLAVIDISNPTSPTFVAETQGPTPGTSLDAAINLYVSGKYAYVVSTVHDSLTIIDISNPTSPTFVAETQGPTPGTSLDGPISVFVSGKYAYVANNDGDSLAVVDVSNPAAPTFVSDTKGPTPGTSLDAASAVFVSGKYAYVTNQLRDSLAIIDISNPSNLVFVAETRGPTPGTSFDGTFGVFVSGKYAYITASTRAAFAVIDVSGAEVSNLYAGGIETDTLQVNAFGKFDQGLLVRGGINTDTGIFSQGQGVFTVASSTSFSTLSASTSLPFSVLSANIIDNDSSSVVNALSLSHGAWSSSANNIGVGIGFALEAEDGIATSTGQIASVMTNTTLSAPTSDLTFSVKNQSGSLMEALRIKSSGNIGIGTTSPYARLSVEGSSALGNSALAGYFTATSSTASIFPYASTTALTVSGINGLQLASGLNGPLQAVNGLVSSTSTLSIGYGGTGLSTAPSYGQLLLGNASGGYTLTSTTSLGINAGAQYDWQKETNFGVSTLTPTTTIPVWLKSQLYASSSVISSSYFDTKGTTGGYYVDGVKIMTASSTNLGTYLGYEAGSAQDGGGFYNTAIGYQSLKTSSSSFIEGVGSLNTAVGAQSLYSQTLSAGQNTAVGYQAMYSNLTGSLNTAVGAYALKGNLSGTWNVALGLRALTSNTTGAGNTALGYNALISDITGSGNTAVGYLSMFNNVSATTSVSVGSESGKGASSYYNQGGTYLGYRAGYGLTTGSDYNTLIGYQAGLAVSTGANNILVGASAGDALTSGSNNIAIGYNIDLPSNTASNQLSIGNLIYGTGLNGSGTTISTGNIGIGTTSPGQKLSVAGDILGNNIIGSYFTATTTTASTFPYASTTALTVAGTNGLQLASGLNGPLQAVNGLVSSTSTLSIGYGGTGLSTAPSYGQLLLGNASGGYTLTSTSTLGILASSAIDMGAEGYLPYYAASAQALTATSSLYLSRSSFLGIGTTTPTSALSVFSSSAPQFQLAYNKDNYLTTGISSSGGVTMAVNGSLGGFSITNSQPTAVGSGTGTAAPAGFQVTGGIGGNSLDTNIGVGGAGGAIQLTAGIGGTAALATFSETGGAGGAISVAGGVGGAALSPSVDFMTRVAGQGGQLTFAGGAGGDASNGGTASSNTAGAGGKFVLKGGAGGNATGATSNNGGNGGSLYVAGGVGGTGSSQNGTNGNVYLGYDSSSAIGNVYFGNQSVSYIGSSGNFGIGTTSPWAKLSVNPNGITGPSFAVGSSTKTDFVVTNGGLVGIGTTVPSSLLTVAGDITTTGAGNVTTNFLIAGGGVRVAFGNATDPGLQGGTGNHSGLFFSGSDVAVSSNSTEVIRFANGGNVGIGTTSPYAKLSVVGQTVSAYFTATTTTASIFPYASTTALTVSGINGLTLGSLNGPLQAVNGAVSATSTLSVAYGGTGATTFGQGWLYSDGGTNALNSSTSPTVNYLTATSTTATSTFAGGFSVLGATGLNVFKYNSNTKVGIGTAAPDAVLSVIGGGVAEPSSILTVTGGKVSNSGAGQSITLTSGTGGNSASTPAAGGAITITGGNGGSNTDTGNGANAGAITLAGGNGGNGSGGTGGNGSTIYIYGGVAGSGSPSGQAGNVILGISAAGVARGNIGIGTTSPFAKLSVAGIGSFDDYVRASVFTATSTTATSTLPNILATNLRLTGSLYDSANSAGTNGYVLQTTGSGTQWVSTSSLNISAGGLSGGTTGMLASWTGASTLTATGTPTAAAYTATSTTATSVFAGGLSVAGSTGLNVLTTGLVGVGKNNPSYELDVNGNVYANNYYVALGGAYRYGGSVIISGTGGDVDPIIFGAQATKVAINTSGAGEIMRFTETGRVGIGTTSPYAKLSVVGETVSAYFTATTTTSSTFPYASSTALTVSGSLYNTSLSDGCVNVTSGKFGSTGSACGSGGVSGGTTGMLASWTGASTLTATGTPTAAAYTATSTTATSTFAGGLSVAGSSGLTVLQGGNASIGTLTPTYDSKLTVRGADAGTSKYIFNFENSAGNPIFYMRNDGVLNSNDINLSAGSGIASQSSGAELRFATGGVLTGNATLSTSGGTDKHILLMPASGGKVGIGTTSPYAKLSVVGETVSAYFTATTTTASTFPYASSTALTVSGSLYNTSLSDGCVNVTSGKFGSTGSACGSAGLSGGTTGMLASWTGASTLTATGTPTAASYYATSTTATSTFEGGFRAAGVAGLNVLQNGNIGIGTSSPLSKLSFLNNPATGFLDNFSEYQILLNTGATAGGSYGIGIKSGTMVFNSGAGGYSFDSAGTGSNMVIDSNGDVGIGGNTSPAFKLTVGSPSSALSTFLSAATGAVVVSYSANATMFAGEYTGASGASGGAFATLHSNDGAALASGDRIGGFQFGGYNGTASSNSGAVVAYASGNWSNTSMPTDIAFETVPSGSVTRAERMRIMESGNVGVASTSPWRKLSVVGTVAINGLTSSTAGNAVCILANFDVVTAGNTTCATSAGATKSNILDISSDEASNIIMGLRPKSYNYKESGERRVGLIAEEVSAIDPRLVEYAKDDITYGAIGVTIKKGDPLTVQYANITPVLTKFVQDFYGDYQGTKSAVASTTSQLSVSSESIKDVTDGINKTKTSVQTLADTIVALDLKVDALIASSTLDINSIISSTVASAVASSTAALASNDSFIQSISVSVKNILASAQDWVVEKFTAKVAYINRVEAETVAISKGMEIVDQMNGSVWCVTIKNGDWNKVQGSCANIATSTIATPVATPTPFISPEPSVMPTPTPVVIDTASSTPETASSTPSNTSTPTESATSTSATTTPTPTPSEPTPTPVEPSTSPAVSSQPETTPTPAVVESAPVTPLAPVESAPAESASVTP